MIVLAIVVAGIILPLIGMGLLMLVAFILTFFSDGTEEQYRKIAKQGAEIERLQKILDKMP
jgi:uncharacterized membrane protein YfcA